jgi:hypothetical protein
MSKAKKETPNLPADINAAIKQQLAEQKGQLGELPRNRISTRNKEFTLPDGLKGPHLDCVVVDFIWSMVHYPGAYNANNPQKANCFALGREAPGSGLLVPHEDASEPQHTDCKDCPKNQWKSAPSGNGKACKNQRRLIVAPPTATEADDCMTLYVSPAGLKNFDSYVNQLASIHQMLPVQVITRITFDADQTYPLLKFEMLEINDRLGFFWAKKEASQELLFRPIESGSKKDAA